MPVLRMLHIPILIALAAVIALAIPAHADTLGKSASAWKSAAATHGAIEYADDYDVSGYDVAFGTIGATADRLLKTATIGSGWRTWSTSYAGEVVSTAAKSLTLTFDADALIEAFSFYAEPKLWRKFKMSVSVTSYDPTTETYETTTLNQDVHGRAGARFWGWLADAGSYLTSITITSKNSFAIGDIAFVTASRSGPPITPTPGPIAGAGLPCAAATLALWLLVRRRAAPAAVRV